MTFSSEGANEVITHGVQARQGLLLLTGEVGTGKTTLLNHLLGWLHQQRAPTAFIFNSHLEISQLFDFVLTGFGVRFDHDRTAMTFAMDAAKPLSRRGALSSRSLNIHAVCSAIS